MDRDTGNMGLMVATRRMVVGANLVKSIRRLVSQV